MIDPDLYDKLAALADKHLPDATSGARAALFADIHALIAERDAEHWREVAAWAADSHDPLIAAALMEVS